MFKVKMRRSSVFIVNFEHISHLVLLLLLLTLSRQMPAGLTRFCFVPTKNPGKLKFFSVFRGVENRNTGKKWVKSLVQV